MNCRLCNSRLVPHFATGEIFSRIISYFECHECGYVQTEDPYWLEEAYSSPINLSDTGIMSRNQSNISIVLATLTALGARHERVVDSAGGYGFLVRLLRDVGIDAYWADPYSENLVARGFEYETGEAALVTAFEVFEHFVSPVDEMQKLISISPNILLTTDIIPSPTPDPKDWWYYGLEHGQHIGFYHIETLKWLARRFDKHLLTDGVSVHLFTDRKMNRSKWYLLQKIANRFPRLMKRGLHSKVWDDHLLLSGKS